MENNRIKILIADDDQGDCLLLKKAFEKSHLANPLYFVHDGVELMDFLLNRNTYEDVEKNPRPDLIFLDLNMPKKDGREALAEIKSNPDLFSIPIIILTTSKAEEDIIKSYAAGGNSYIQKPVDFESLSHIIETFSDYWFQIVKLPKKTA